MHTYIKLEKLGKDVEFLHVLNQIIVLSAYEVASSTGPVEDATKVRHLI